MGRWVDGLMRKEGIGRRNAKFLFVREKNLFK